MSKKVDLVTIDKKPKFAVRRKNRCRICGRSRAYLRKFAMCRICFRERALAGEMSFFIAAAAFRKKHGGAGVIDENTYNAVCLAVLVSMVACPAWLRSSLERYEGVEIPDPVGFPDELDTKPPPQRQSMENMEGRTPTIVICSVMLQN